jgi:citrate lyase subunit beta/citryl-CoA lyase
MWSIHPAQIRPILEAMAPDAEAIDQASAILMAAIAAQWAPISHQGQLHDRASYRFFWQVLQRAFDTGRVLPAEVRAFFQTS